MDDLGCSPWTNHAFLLLKVNDQVLRIARYGHLITFPTKQLETGMSGKAVSEGTWGLSVRARCERHETLRLHTDFTSNESTQLFDKNCEVVR